MADVRPFRGLRYDLNRVQDLSRVVCPPYDVIGAAEQERLYKRSPHNVVRLELGKDGIGEGGARYQRARTYLRSWIESGVLSFDPRPALYLYQHVFALDGPALVRRGVIAAVRLHAWTEGVVVPHEATMSGPKEDRLRLMRATAANLSPIMALYDDPAGAVARALEHAWQSPALAAATSEGPEEHILRRCDDPEVIGAVSRAFSAARLYIADGHHRYETALSYRDERAAQAGGEASPDVAWGFVMILLVEFHDPGLAVLGTHRLVRGVPADRVRGLVPMLERWFHIESVDDGLPVDGVLRSLRASPGTGGSRQPTSIGLVLGGYCYRLRLRPGSDWRAVMPAGTSEPWRRLDVVIADTLILDRGLGLGERERDAGKHVTYTRDPVAAVSGAMDGLQQLAVLLGPTPAEQLRIVADAGDRMPQKSTYFHPKPLTGLVLHALEGEDSLP